MQTTQTEEGNSTQVHEQVEGCPVRYRFPKGVERVFGPPVEDEESWFDLGIEGLPRVCRIFKTGIWIPADKGPSDDGL